MDAAAYIVAQFGGGAVRKEAAFCILGSHPAVTVVDNVSVLAAEALGAFWLATGVIAVVTGKAPAAAAGLTIGGSLLVGIAFAAPISNAVLNPAVALAIGSFSLMYVVGPGVGAGIALSLYPVLREREVSE